MGDRIIASWEVREICIGLSAELEMRPREDPRPRAHRPAGG
jgi:hypothetical protein